VANRLVARGCGGSAMFVLEHMGGAGERTVETTAAAASSRDFAEFNTLAIHCVAATDAPILPRVPGLPDDAFRHDGQLTKREVRAVTLAALGPVPGGLLWDVGAGCGSVAIEWMRAARGAKAIAFERDAGASVDDRRQCRRARHAGTGDRSRRRAGDPRRTACPSAVFVGGAVSDPAVMRACWNALPSGGRLVANAVTLEGEARWPRISARWAANSCASTSHAVGIGRKHAMRPRMAVTQWRAAKP
jgi:precorrin-6B C5,15-methyltransferase / cobalt-precorrin-6B C5,C15-methyltransferase